MTGDDRASAVTGLTGRRAELVLRVVSALVLAPLAIGAVILGGWPFVVFWSLAAVGVYWEWTGLIFGAAGPLRGIGIAALAITGLLAGAGYAGAALIVLAVGALAAGLATAPRRSARNHAEHSPGNRQDYAPDQGVGARSEAYPVSASAGRARWALGGVAYAGIVLAGPVLLRRDAELGMVALIFLFAVVWATDILAYFAGCLIGGPKLAPGISPKKTWSGAIGGVLGAVAAGAAVAAGVGLTNPLAVCGLALLLSAACQAGDLFESAVKRRFGVKDSSRIIPGHGGLMDRLDGFLAAAGVAAMLGVARGGLDGAARGLLVW